MYTTILVPVDISEKVLTDNALDYAERLAHLTGATLHFFHVMPNTSVFIPETGYIPTVSVDEVKQITLKELKRITASLTLPADRITCSMSFGSPRDEVLALAESINADLIIVGSHRPSVKTYLLGSNASAIVRHAKTSVLVVR